MQFFFFFFIFFFLKDQKILMIQLYGFTLWTFILGLSFYVKDKWTEQYIEKLERKCLFGDNLSAFHHDQLSQQPAVRDERPAIDEDSLETATAANKEIILFSSGRNGRDAGERLSTNNNRTIVDTEIILVPQQGASPDQKQNNDCKYDNHKDEFVCTQSSKSKTLTIVIPFPPKQLSLVLQNIDSWITWEFFPCDPKKGVRKFARLVFYLSRSDAQTLHVLQDRLVHANHTWRHCFSDVSFAVSDMDEDTDKYGPGTLSMFYSVFTPQHQQQQQQQQHSFFRLPADYMLWMEPDLVPIRREWLDTLFFRDIVMSPPFWMRGSIPRYPGGQGDRHINGNALFAVGDPRFQQFVRGSRGAFHQYDSFDQSLWTHLLHHPESQSISHLFAYTDSIQNRGYDLYDIAKFRQQHPDTVLCHGKGMLKSVENFLSPHLKNI